MQSGGGRRAADSRSDRPCRRQGRTLPRLPRLWLRAEIGTMHVP